MMRIAWLAATDEARLLHDIAKVPPVAVTPWGRNCEDALIDAPCLVRIGGLRRDGLLRLSKRSN
jgi:hypothetical protein